MKPSIAGFWGVGMKKTVGVLWGTIPTYKKWVSGISANPLNFMVPRDRIELPTRGFSAQDSIVSENCVIPTH